MTRPDASIVVATARDAARLTAALDRLPSTIEGVDYELVVVLNGADADVVVAARERDDVDHLVESTENLGFAGAVNLGHRSATGEFIVLLHDDTEPVAGWLARLLDTARQRREIGVIGPATLRRGGMVEVAGAVLTADGSSWAVAQGRSPADSSIGAARPTDYCGSNAVLIRSATWEAIGGLEEALFPAGYADVDLAFAARRTGWEVWFEPQAEVVHESAGGTLAPGFRSWVFTRNRAVFVEKWSEALEAFEPLDLTDQEGMIQRAVDRAARRRPEPGPLPRTPTRTTDEVGLLREYVREQDVWAAGVHREWPRLTEEIRTLQQALATADEQTQGHVSTIATLAREVERLRGRESFLDGECAGLAQRLTEGEPELQRLRAHEAELAAILGGRWWRLRSRVRRFLRR